MGYLWASPASALGALLGLIGIAGRGRMSIHTGALEVEGRLYLGASAWALTLGRDLYRDNPFEREAMDATAGRRL